MLKLGIDHYDYKAAFYLSEEEKFGQNKKPVSLINPFWLFAPRAKNPLKTGLKQIG